MFSFHIHAASRDTGQDVDFVLEAESESEARTKANRMGYVVARVVPVEQSAPQSSSLPNDPHESQFEGPPVNCRWCGGRLRRERKGTGNGMGCLLALIGVGMLFLFCIFPFNFIGILVFLWGIHIGTQVEGFWRCKKCDEKFPRKVHWYDFG